ncbi:protein phosphatase 1 regulatory subunit 42-like [Diorhabda sublineata]|uniref:protein phosphatase 1 regulatory subunit 42-like n=1 Tax=Diorhabda sublineata TaxID=1163346 RepID=UPI0024E0705F|nr:protein phosphatase 1 regulatory subunit 42-like [Diorhabda sublineata]
MEIERRAKFVKKEKNICKKDAVKRNTHLYLQEKNLKQIPKISSTKDVVVIYLFNNDITEIENLNGGEFGNLTSLYLQNNRIKRIENLNLKNLRRLFIGHNNISVVEGLENLVNLEELHIENQNMPDGTALCFDPRSLLKLSRTLQILNISYNKIVSFASLSPLIELTSIDASHCKLNDLKEVCDTIRNWKYLNRAVFQGNPFSKLHRYREDIIINCYYLESLDGKEIQENTRQFLKRLEREKIARSKFTIPAVPNLSEIVETLPKNYSPAVQKTVSAAILKGKKYNPLNISEMSETEGNIHIAWTSLPKRRPIAKPLKTKPNTIDNSVIINRFP